MKRDGPKTEPWGTPQGDDKMEEEPQVTEPPVREVRLEPVVRRTHDTKTRSETI